MAIVTYRSVYFSGGPHQRQPRTGPGGFTLISEQPGGNLVGTFLVGWVPPKQVTVGAPPNPVTCDFSFMTVSGGSLTAGGPPVGVSSFVYGTEPPKVIIDSVPVTVLVVYVAVGGRSTGATVDEFDETTGQLLNDTFVTVTPDSTGSLTTNANVEGFVDTTSAAELITARTTTSPSGVDFVGWVNLDAANPMNPSPNLSLNKGQSIRALAFYQAPPVGTIKGIVRENTHGIISLLSDALISAVPGGTTKTGPDGTYILENVQAGPIQLTASHDLAGPVRVMVNVVAGHTITQDFQLTAIVLPPPPPV